MAHRRTALSRSITSARTTGVTFGGRVLAPPGNGTIPGAAPDLRPGGLLADYGETAIDPRRYPPDPAMRKRWRVGRKFERFSVVVRLSGLAAVQGGNRTPGSLLRSTSQKLG